jgi:hypothetical protein
MTSASSGVVDTPPAPVGPLAPLGAAGQALFIALYVAELAGMAGRGGRGFGFFAVGGAAVLLFAGAALVGRVMSVVRQGPIDAASPATEMRHRLRHAPEAILLPLFVAGALAWALGHYGAAWPLPAHTRAIGAATMLAAIGLCLAAASALPGGRARAEHLFTALATGCLAAAALAGVRAPVLIEPLGRAALLLLAAALVTSVRGRTRGEPTRIPWRWLTAGLLVPMAAVAAALLVGLGDLGNQRLLLAAFAVHALALLGRGRLGG